MQNCYRHCYHFTDIGNDRTGLEAESLSAVSGSYCSEPRRNKDNDRNQAVTYRGKDMHPVTREECAGCNYNCYVANG